MDNRKKTLVGTIAAALMAGSISMGPVIAVNVVYEKYFNRRITTYDPLYYSIEDFPHLRRERHTFKTDSNRNLVGYMYYYPSVSQKGLVVLSHGYGGGGQRTYMDCTNYLCKHGFYVFAYDATGNDESEGTGIGGFPQGIIDINHAIEYVESLDMFNKLPLFLFGHSWGGYNSANALYYHPEVKAIVSISGFNNSIEMIKHHGYQYGGASADNMIPFVSNKEQQMFGRYADSSAMKAFANSTSGVFIIQSYDDPVVLYESGYKFYYDTYKNDPRFKFILYENRGHNTVYFDESSIKYTKNLNEKWDAFCKNNPTELEKEEFLKKNINRDIWNDRLDEDLFSQIIDFYSKYI